MSKVRIALGITSYNGATRLDHLLRSISMRTPWLANDAAIVLVDDGSPRESETQAVATYWSGLLPLIYVAHGANRGISAGWNTASRTLNADIVVLLNDDVIVSQGWLESLVHVLDHSPGVGVVGQTWHAFLPEDVPALLASVDSDLSVIPRDPVSKAPMPERRTLYEDTWPGRVMAPTGQLFAFRRADFDVIGGFDEGYKSFYEESSYGTSMAADLKKIGVQINWPFCWHEWSATFSANPELQAAQRMAASRLHYRQKWQVPEGVHEFDFTNPRYLGAIGDVEIEFLRKSGVCRGVLRQDGAFIEAA
jgi:glycosyltransferase involved in cell wall biosynthesis